MNIDVGQRIKEERISQGLTQNVYDGKYVGSREAWERQ
jgi:hypothetical protein